MVVTYRGLFFELVARIAGVFSLAYLLACLFALLGEGAGDGVVTFSRPVRVC